MNRQELEELIRSVIQERLEGPRVLGADLTSLPVTEANRLDTGNPQDRVWTRDLFTLAQSPRLGAGLMVMEKTTFPWELSYDEIDCVLEGQLTVEAPMGSVTAGPGQVILIPKGSKIRFSAPDRARFLYVTYPADWQNQAAHSP
ncbi:MAG: ethanolamine utilization protein EutQ [Clostridiales bacterium]|nr:ethanolamine utilization protein EutQ [Clostridiales bacterium]